MMPALHFLRSSIAILAIAPGLVGALPVDRKAGPSTPGSVISETRSAIVEVRTNCGAGSGFFFVNEGDVYVMTNTHVVRSAPGARCVTARYDVVSKDGSISRPGVLAYYDPVGDIAVLKVFERDERPSRNVTPLILFPSSPRAGQRVVVWGSPYNEGIVPRTGVIAELIQLRVAALKMNVPVQPGNSGGPVIDVGTRQVIGVVTSRLQDAAGDAGVSTGESFAVNVDYVRSIISRVDWRAIRSLPMSGAQSPAVASDAPGGASQVTKASIEPIPQASLAWLSFGFQTALLRAAALLPGLFGITAALWLLIAGRPRYTLLYGLASCALLVAGNLIFRSGPYIDAGRAAPYLIAPLFALFGVLIVTHLLFRAILATTIFATRADAAQSRTERTATALLFRPWVSIPMGTVLLLGSWTYVAWDMVWKAGN